MVVFRKRETLAQFGRLTECNPGVLRYDIAAEQPTQIGFNNLGGKT
jgi:hypothetical protein